MVEHIATVTIGEELRIVLISFWPWLRVRTYAHHREEFTGSDLCRCLYFHKRTLN
jgi:hypothetical protein